MRAFTSSKYTYGFIAIALFNVCKKSLALYKPRFRCFSGKREPQSTQKEIYLAGIQMRYIKKAKVDKMVAQRLAVHLLPTD